MEKQATREAYGQALEALGATNENVVVLDADLSKSTKTNLFQKKYPERFFDMGIAEQNMMGVAAGFAATGKVPFASTFAVFATGRAYDQIRNTICYPRLNVKIAATHAGITVGEDGGSHQALEDINLMRGLPNMTVLVPADGPEAYKAVMAAAAYDGPVYIRLGRSAVLTVTDPDADFVIGKGKLLREGTDVTLIACGMMVAVALDAAELLAAEGVHAAVIDMSTIKPIDRALICEWAEKTGAVVTAEEHNIIGGLGSAVSEVLALECPTPLEMVGVEDVFGESGTAAQTLVTDSDGKATVYVKRGSYVVTATHSRFTAAVTQTVKISAGRTVKLTGEILENVQLVVTNAYGAPLSGAVVTVGGKSITTGTDGTASFSLKRGSYVAQVACTGYSAQSVQLSVTGSIRERVQLK